MNTKVAFSICLICLVAAGYLVPTTAHSVGSTEFVDGFGGDATDDRDVIIQDGADDGRMLYATPATGLTGESASIVGEDGAKRLELDFAATVAGGKGINPGARSTFDDVFVLVNEFEEPTAVRIDIVEASDGSSVNIDDIRGFVTFYAGTGVEAGVGGPNSIELQSESATSIGLEFDPVGNDLAGTSISFAFVLTVPDDAISDPADPAITGDWETAGLGDGPSGTATGEDSMDGENTTAIDGAGANTEKSGDDITPDAPTAPGSAADATTGWGVDGVAFDASLRSSLSTILFMLLVLIPVVVVGRRGT